MRIAEEGAMFTIARFEAIHNLQGAAKSFEIACR